MIEALVFDVDGVLVRAGEFARLLDDEHGISRESTQPFFRGPFIGCVTGTADLKEAIAPYLKEWGWKDSVDDCLRVWFEADSEMNTGLLDRVSELRAKGYPCYVASTQERHRAEYLETVMGFASRFDGLFFSARVGVGKPAVAFYDHVASAIGCSAGSILFFDDHEANVDGARAAGWNAELYRIGDAIDPLLDRHGVGL